MNKAQKNPKSNATGDDIQGVKHKRQKITKSTFLTLIRLICIFDCYLFDDEKKGIIRITLFYNFTFLRRKALVITLTELKLIAKAPSIGESKTPKNGNKIPAAMGIPTVL